MIKVASVVIAQNDFEVIEQIRRNYDFDTKIFKLHPDIQNMNIDNIMEEINRWGADILIARGSFASGLKARQPLPVVEIRITNHELFCVLAEAKKISKKDVSEIAFLGPDNMYSSFSVEELNQQLGIHLHYYSISALEEVPLYPAIEAEIISTKPDAFVGGIPACINMRKHGIPSVDVRLSEECVDNAFRRAQSIAYTIELRQQNEANLNAILDYTKNGIIQFDASGKILLVNRFVQRLLAMTEREISGQNVIHYVQGISQKDLINVIESGREINSIHLQINGADFIASITPVYQEKGKADSAIIAIYEGKQVDLLLEDQAALKKYHQTARFHFDSYITRSGYSKVLVKTAKHLASLPSPILFTGPEGCGQDELAECIFNEKKQNEASYIVIDCLEFQREELDQYLWGDSQSSDRRGIFEAHAQGIIYLKNIEALSQISQRRITVQLKESSSCLYLILSTSKDIVQLMKDNVLDAKFVYAVNVNALSFAPLKEHPADIEGWAEQYLSEFQNTYGRVIHLSKEALNLMYRYPWPGNLYELRNVIQKLFVNASERNISAEQFSMVLRTNMPPQEPLPEDKKIKLSSASKEELQILLEKNNGSRTTVANILGISTTTLWRRMKKEGLC